MPNEKEIPTAIGLFLETRDAFVAAKLSTGHEVRKALLNGVKSVFKVQRAKELVIRIPAQIAKSILSAASTAAAAAAMVPGLDGVMKALTGAAVDMGADKLIEEWMKSDTKVAAKTDLKAAIFDLKEHRTGQDAFLSLPKHVAQLVDAHKYYYDGITKATAKLNKIDPKSSQKEKGEETIQILSELFMSFHALRWATAKVVRDAHAVEKALEAIKDLESKNGEWMGNQAVGIMKIAEGYLGNFKDTP